MRRRYQFCIIYLSSFKKSQMGVYLSEPITDKHIKEGESKDYTYCVAEMQGWRKSMEDAAIHETDLGDGNSLFAVFDGHGGHEVSKYVEEKFVKQLINLDSYKKKDYVAALDHAFRMTDQLLSSDHATKELNAQRNVHQSDPISKNTGCTANVVLITKDHYIVANAGDSRSALCREGKAINLSEDHKPESKEEEDRIKKAGGVVYMGRVNGGLNLTRSFGDFDYKKNTSLGYHQQMITCKPDIRTFERSKKDEFIIVGCDGIWQRYVDNSQGLIDMIKEHINNKRQNKHILEAVLNQLLAKDTMSGLGCDNMTSILIRFK